MKGKIDLSKCSTFIVFDANSFVLNCPVHCTDYSVAIDSAFSMIRECCRSHLNCYGVVIYCFEKQYNSYPKCLTFISLGEIVEQLIANKKIDREELLSDDFKSLNNMLG